MRQKNYTRVLPVLVMVVMIIGSIGVTPWHEAEASYLPDNPVHFNIETTTLGTTAIGQPLSGEGREHSYWCGNYVKWGGNAFRVLDPDTTDFSVADETGNKKHTMLLDADLPVAKVAFDADKQPNEGASKANEWAYSDLKAYCNGVYLQSLPAAERDAIAYSTKPARVSGDGNGYWRLRYAPLDHDRVFVLDAVEATRPSYGYSNLSEEYNEEKRTDPTIALNRVKQDAYFDLWWTRSPYNSDKAALSAHVGFVYGLSGYTVDGYEGGYFASNYSNYVHRDDDRENGPSASPAFNVDLDRVLWSTLIDGDADERYEKTFALTLKSDYINFMVTEGQSITEDNGTFTVPYTVTYDAENSDAPNCVTVMVVSRTEQGRQIKQYGLLDLGENSLSFEDSGSGLKTATGTGTFTLPGSFDASTDTVYLMAEYVPASVYYKYQENSFSSSPLEVLRGTVKSAPTPKTDLVYDETAQELVAPGEAENGTMQYALGTDDQTAPADGWSIYIPTALGAGTYCVWYKVVGDVSHIETEAACVTASIGQRPVTIAAADQTVELGSAIATDVSMVSIAEGQLASDQSLSSISLELGQGISTNEPGEFENAIVPGGAVILDASGEDVTANYEITCRNGKLTVTKIKSKVKEAPTAGSLTYTGQAQALVTAGEAEGGTLYYAVTAENTPPADDLYTESIPTGTDVGIYYVWYKVVEDATHSGTEAACVISMIAPEFGDPDFAMPEDLAAIGESAFEGVTAMTVVDAHSCATIGQDAFKGTGLRQIKLPKDCEISDAAFDEDGLIFVYASSGGSTEAYCAGHDNLVFIAE